MKLKLLYSNIDLALLSSKNSQMDSKNNTEKIIKLFFEKIIDFFLGTPNQLFVLQKSRITSSHTATVLDII